MSQMAVIPALTSNSFPQKPTTSSFGIWVFRPKRIFDIFTADLVA